MEVLYGFIWFYMVLYGFIWFYMVLYGFIWFYMVLLENHGNIWGYPLVICSIAIENRPFIVWLVVYLPL